MLSEGRLVWQCSVTVALGGTTTSGVGLIKNSSPKSEIKCPKIRQLSRYENYLVSKSHCNQETTSSQMEILS